MQTVEITNNNKKNTHKLLELKVREIFSRDFKDYLASNSFLSVKSILRHMGNIVDESTIRRNINQKTTPSAKTLRAFYAFKFKEERDEILFELVPEEIKITLQKHFSVMQTPLSTGNQSRRIDIQIANDVHFAELYAFTAFENGTSLETIQEEFGRRSIQRINEMIASGILAYNPQTQKVYPGKNRSTYPRDVVQALAKAALQNIAVKNQTVEEREIGYIQFCNLSDTALRQLVNIEQAAHRAKLDIINQHQNTGNNKVFFTSFIDTFTSDDEFKTTDNEVSNVH